MADTAGLASRRAALRALRRVHEGGAWAQRAVDRELQRADLDDRDAAFAANLAYQTLRFEGRLDWALGRVVTRPLEDVEPVLLDILRLGAWQVLHGRVPDRAAVGTAVDLARAEIGDRATGFVNGVLRGLARAAETLDWPDEATDDGLGLALGYPAWVVAEARARFGERARAVLEAGNEPPGLTLRCVGDRAAVAEELRAAGLEATPARWAPESLHAPGANPAALDAVRDGRAAVQDEASTLVGHAVASGLAEVVGSLVVDLCAAPGGKAAHLATLGARVMASDLHPGRVGQMTEALARMGLGDSVSTLVADAAQPPLRPACADAVLVDAPCTGLGVVRRRPDLRWRREGADPDRLGALQLELLSAAAWTVRPGGWLVYSVCTWPEAETRAVAQAFAETHEGLFALADPRDLALGAGTVLAGDVGVQLDPAGDGTDGMYIAAFRRAG